MRPHETGNVRLVGSQLFSSRHSEGSTAVVEAQYFVRIEGLDKPGQGDYKLTVMSDEAYKDWSLERQVHGQADPEEIYPLHVTDETLAGDALTTFVERTWLNTDHPKDIVLIGQFLLYIEPGDQSES